MLTVTRVREQIVNGMPDCLKHATAAGIGMFIAFVGLGWMPAWMVVIIVARELAITGLRMLAASKNLVLAVAE